MPFIHKIFHPILRLFTRSDCSTEPEIGTTALYPQLHHMKFLQLKFGEHIHTGGTCSVRGTHERTDDGKLSHIRLVFAAHAGTPTAKFTRIILQVLFRNPGKVQQKLSCHYIKLTFLDTDEIIEIIDYQPKSTPFESTQDQAYGIQDNMITWDWQYELDPIRHLGLKNYSHRQAFEISINAVRRVKAEFKLVGYYKDGKKKMKRSIPTKDGMLEQLLVLQDA